jgi:hypothetical protein
MDRRNEFGKNLPNSTSKLKNATLCKFEKKIVDVKWYSG